MFRAVFTAAIVLLFAPAAISESFPSMTGGSIQPSQNLYLYNAPPNAILRPGRSLKGVLHPTETGNRIYPLDRKQNGYEVKPSTGTLKSPPIVTRQVDVLHKGKVERWIELSDPERDTDQTLGWTVCSSASECADLKKNHSEE